MDTSVSRDHANARQCKHCAKYFDATTTDGAAHLASCREHNGYKNYETWCVSLWLDNDEGLYREWRLRARRAVDAGRLANELQEWMENEASEATHAQGVFADLLGAALSEVDWYEIAENMIEGLQ